MLSPDLVFQMLPERETRFTMPDFRRDTLHTLA
jgi:hypothetical protein